MTFKKIIIRLAIGIALGASGCLIGWLADGYISESTLKESETFCKNADSTIAILDDTYKETTIKVMKGKAKMFTYNYSYKLEETSYKGSFTSNIIAKNPVIKIWYDKTNPSLSTNTDPCATYEHYKTKQFSEYRDYYYGAALLFALVGLGLVYANVVNLFKLLISPSKKNENVKSEYE